MGGACFLGGRWSAGRSETAKIDTVVLQNQLSEIRELATVTYAYTNMAQFESSNDFYGVKIPFTTTSFQSDQKAAMEEKALSRGLLAEARAKAVSSVEQLFAAALPDTYTVTVQ